jgi:carboxylesterase
MYGLNIKEENALKAENNREAVLLFHGLTGSPFELRQFAKALHKAGYDVFYPILPGHCQSVDALKRSVWQDWYNFALETYDELKKNYDKVYVSGLCLGAVLAVGVAQERSDVAGVIAVSTTLFLDGWSLPWFKFLFPLGLYTVLKFFYTFPESEPYGIKNEMVRKKIVKMLVANDGALDSFPMLCILELLKISKFIRKKERMKKVTVPILLFHSLEDDLTSIKSAECVYNNISSESKTLIKLDNSYHLITLDNDKNVLAEKTIEFIKNISGVNEGEIIENYA